MGVYYAILSTFFVYENFYKEEKKKKKKEEEEEENSGSSKDVAMDWSSNDRFEMQCEEEQN